MADNDLSDRELEVEAKLSESGASLRIKSRAIAALDWLGASRFRRSIADNEGKAAEIAARAKIRAKLIEAGGELALERLRTDPAIADQVARALLTDTLPQLGRSPRQQANVDEIAQLALQDLVENPEQKTTEGEISPEFLARFNRYAEDASTAELRERWAKVLSVEIRVPQSFTRHAMRVLDELQQYYAQAFETVVSNRFGLSIPKTTISWLDINGWDEMYSKNLLIRPAFFANVRMMKRAIGPGGVPVHLVVEEKYGVAIAESELQKLQPENALFGLKETTPDPAIEGAQPAAAPTIEPFMKVDVLGTVGTAISKIVPYSEEESAKRLAQLIESFISREAVWLVEVGDDGYAFTKMHDPLKDTA